VALGAHWEWRGFGRASPELRARFESLERLFPPQEVVDRYIWIPRSTVNIKLRVGVQEGLKFKRLLRKDGDLELWLEDPGELYEFPLQATAWESLGAELERAGLSAPSIPDRPSGLRTALEHLKTVDERITIVEVHKNRRAGLWRGPGGAVLVEWSRITRPETVFSLGLESWDAAHGRASHRGAIRQAILNLHLDAEGLEAMSYLAATEIWAGGQRICV
jgi:hypothetical protein